MGPRARREMDDPDVGAVVGPQRAPQRHLPREPGGVALRRRCRPWPARCPCRESTRQSCGPAGPSMTLAAGYDGRHITTGGHHDDRVPHRDRLARRDRGRRVAVLGGPDRALDPSFLDRVAGRRPDAARGRARDRHPQEGSRPGQHGARDARPVDRRPDRGGGGRGDRRHARRALPALRVADRLGHPVQHERQRGHLEPGDRDGGRRARLQDARAPERPRQPVAVLQRHLPDGDAHRRRHGDRGAAAAPGALAPRRARRPRPRHTPTS